ncbi:MAG TPA: peptidylprolyl isomerase [Terriglobales bacterium]|nr:peptidylprolyl isomerase [Terriglobales bacterium]
MLNFFRRRDTVVRIMLGGFLVLICAAMVMYLIPNVNNSDSTTPINEQTVATVNGTAITGVDLTTELARVEGNQSVPAQLVPMLGQQVLRNLVIQQAVADQAKQLGLVPSTAEIVQAARQQDPELYPNGKYVGDAQAAQVVAQAQLTLAQYQDQLRQSLMVSKIYNLVTDPVRVSGAEVQRQFLRDNEKATVDYVFFNPTALESQVQVVPAALQAYYQQHQASYNSPERRKLEVLLANQAQIAAQIPISNAAVDQYYHQNIAKYTHPEQVKAAHILLKFPDSNPTPTEIAATRQRAEAVLKQVQANPANFAALAKKYSQDDASAAQGGELGFIQRNQTVANFEKTAFSLPVGQISGLVQTEYGFHIIKVEAHTAASVDAETAVHDQIVALLQNDQAVDKAQGLINQAATLAATTPLPQVAQQLNLQYFATAPLSRTDPVAGIGVNPDFAAAVFSASTGGLTPPVQVAQGFALAKVDQIVPPGPQPLAAVQDAVTTDFKRAQAQTLALDQAQALQKAAAKLGLKAAAASLHLAVKTSAPLTRSGSLPDAGAISSFADTLFALKPGAVGPVASVGSHSQLVYALDTLQQPSPADFASQSATVAQTLLGQKRDAIFGAYTDALVAQLTKQGKIKIDQAAFQRVLDAAAPDSGTTPPPPSPLGLG